VPAGKIANAVVTFSLAQGPQCGGFYSPIERDPAIDFLRREHNRKRKPFVCGVDPDPVIKKSIEGIKRRRQTTRLAARNERAKAHNGVSLRLGRRMDFLRSTNFC
jgi:hypothetical protein